MTDFSYKVVMTSTNDCQHKQFVAFHEEDYLNYWQAGSAARDEMSSQTCYNCGENHSRDEYVATDVQCARGTSAVYTELLPRYKNTDERMEGLA